MKTVRELVADFDGIAAALAAAPVRERLTPAERALLWHVPPRAKRAIDIGCGDGVVTRALASRGIHVLGVDFSPGMIELARARTAPSLPVEYRQLEAMTGDLPDNAFDVVVSVAALHHMHLAEVVGRLARLVVPGGTLLLQDVMNRRGLLQWPMNATAAITRRARELITHSRTPPQVTTLYLAHGANEQYLDVSSVASVYRTLLPSAHVFTHLEWRYSVVWHRPIQLT
jgi:SAM-dependent methyltransferase